MTRLFSFINVIPVVFAAGVLEAQPSVSIDKTSVSLSAMKGGSAVSTTVNISGSGTQGFAALLGSVTGGAQWLTISSGGAVGSSVTGSVPGVLTIIANPGSLDSGTYTGSVQLFPNPFPNTQVTPVTIQVAFTISPLAVSPTSLQFNYQRGSSFPPGQSITLSGVAPFTAKVKNSSGWLRVSPDSGSSPTTLTAAVDFPGSTLSTLTAGTKTDVIQITPFSSTTLPPIEVNVTLTVTDMPTVTATPNPISLSYQIGGATGATNSATTTLTLTNPGTAGLDFLITPNSAGWLTVNPSSGTIPAGGAKDITIGYLTTTNLPPGTYGGQVSPASLSIFIPNAANSQITRPVQLLVTNSPVLNVPTATLAFNYQINGATPAAKTLTATSSAVAADAPSGQQMPLTLSAQSVGNWLSVGDSTTITGRGFTVSVNPIGLQANTYNGTVTVTGVGAANGPQTIPVVLTVSNDPLISVSFGGCSALATASCTLNFPVQTGGPNPVTTQNVRVQTSTNAQANITASVSMTSSADCGSSWLATALSGTTLTSDISVPVTVTPGSIASGKTCAGTLTIAGTNPTTGVALPNSPVTIPVNLYVSSSPMLAPPNPLALTFNLGPNSSDSKSFTVGSTSSDLSFTVSTPAQDTWLSAGPTSRSTNAASNTVIVVANTNNGSLRPGTYTSFITITSAGVLDSPLTVPVTLNYSAGSISLDPTSLAFSQVLGAAAPDAKKFTVKTSGVDVSFNTSVTMDQGAGWLTAAPASATATSATPASVTVSVDGSKLQPGTYTGKVIVTSTTASIANSGISVAVSFEVKPGTLSATPTSLTFGQVQGGGTPPAQKITVKGDPGALAFTITTSTNNNSGNWLTATPASGNTNSDVSVSVNSGTLAPGQYTGKVTITSTGATGSPLDVPVTLNVAAPATVAISQTSLTLNAVIGSTNAISPQTVQVTSSANGTAFTATVDSASTWLTVTPGSGTAPANLSISVNPAGLVAKDYTGTISINSPSSATNPAATITVKLTVQSIPAPVLREVANAASWVRSSISPGENIVILGTGVGPADLTLAKVVNGAFETTVGNTRVLFDGIPAPIIYARADQTAVMVPYGVGGRATTDIVVEYQGVRSAAIHQAVVNSAPGIYTANQSGSGPGAILNQDYSYNINTPAPKDSVVVVYMTGEGATAPASPDGAIAPSDGKGLYKPIAPVTATVDGMPATIEYYGTAPGIVYGVMQVNVRIPSTLTRSGNLPLVVNVGSNGTQTGTSAVTVWVQ